MLNILEMVAEIVREVDELKREKIGSLEDKYSKQLEKIDDLTRQLNELWETCKGKPKIYVDRKRQQLEEKIDRLRKQADEWYEAQKKKILEQIESNLNKMKQSAQEAADAEKQSEQESKDLADKMVNS